MGADFANGAFEQLGRHVCCLRPQFRIYLGAAPMGKSRDCLACWLLWATPLHHHPHTFLIITTSTFHLLSGGSQLFCERSTWANTKPKCIRLIIISSKARVNDTDSMLRLGHSLAEFWQQIIVRSHEVVNRFSNLKVMTGSNYQQFNSEFIYLSRPASEIMMYSERRG